ncbi:uncharacterized protein LOC111379224 [Olea europaea var. sylvestris]|uniref:uncharacterized protein LOC111379224 n=1 Tax=Olea europaea var. sylvestris TaxID=158386 RepID=UPI000C1D541E|nr:uncharacterized protein LOC111379224 [Olea europaea var. sylvestris]
MRSKKSLELLSYLEIEKIAKRMRKKKREARKNSNTMADNENGRRDTRALRDFALLQVTRINSVIRKPSIAANNFEIQLAILQMIQTSIQFHGFPSDDPNAHIASFLEVCDTFKQNGVTDDAIRLWLFPFSLRDRAKSWLNALPADSVTSWEDLAQKFLAKFFPPAKTAKMRNEISNFSQLEGETLYKAWEQYKDLLRRCSHHGLPKWMQVQNLYNGLAASTRTLIDATSGGTFMGKSPDDAYEQLSMANQLTANAIHLTPPACDFCHGNHPSEECQVGNPFFQSQVEQAHFVANYNQQNNPYSATYNPGWKNHPNFSWNNQNALKPPPGPSSSDPPKEKSTLEEAMAQLATNTNRFIIETKTNFQNQAASIQNLEVQVDQLANMLTGRQQGNLPARLK